MNLIIINNKKVQNYNFSWEILYIKYLGRAYTSNKTSKTRPTINIDEKKNSNKKTYGDVTQPANNNFR